MKSSTAKRTRLNALSFRQPAPILDGRCHAIEALIRSPADGYAIRTIWQHFHSPCHMAIDYSGKATIDEAACR